MGSKRPVTLGEEPRSDVSKDEANTRRDSQPGPT
jgi:hypothetical protein